MWVGYPLAEDCLITRMPRLCMVSRYASCTMSSHLKVTMAQHMPLHVLGVLPWCTAANVRLVVASTAYGLWSLTSHCITRVQLLLACAVGGLSQLGCDPDRMPACAGMDELITLCSGTCRSTSCCDRREHVWLHSGRGRPLRQQPPARQEGPRLAVLGERLAAAAPCLSCVECHTNGTNGFMGAQSLVMPALPACCIDTCCCWLMAPGVASWNE